MFDSALSAALGGPDWLVRRRADAAASVAAAALPSPAEEVWRYSRIDELDVAAFDAAPADVADSPAAGLLAAAEADAAAVVRFRNGRLTAIEVGRGDGLEVAPLADVADGDAHLGRAMRSAPDVFADANLAFGPDPLVVRSARGAVIDGPVVIDHFIDADGAAVFPRVVVVAGENSELTVVEVHGSADVTALNVPVSELIAEQAARLRYLAVQDLGTRVWQVGSQVADIGRDAHLLSSLAALGGDYARSRVDTRMTGKGAEGDIVAVYHGAHDQALDFRTFQDHIAPHTQSDLVFKGAVDDRARAIYTGLIRIEKDANGVDAHQTNRNIKLSPDAWAESVPNLEIENNDVKCSHASAVGPIDEDQQFYLESRGVPTAVAERLVVLGFYDEVLRQLPEPSVAAAIGEVLAERLEAIGTDAGAAA